MAATCSPRYRRVLVEEIVAPVHETAGSRRFRDDLDVIEGKKDQLVGRLQERYGYSKEQAEKNSRSGIKITELLSGASCP